MCAMQQRILRRTIGVASLILLVGCLFFVSTSRVLAQEGAHAGVTAASADGAASPDIIGGREAVPGAWPWQVALLYQGTADAYRGQFCGGSLIAADWVLTAAHCVEGTDASLLDVLVGAHRLSNGGQRIRADLIIVHPAYDPFELDSDLALIRLSQPVTQTPISLYALSGAADEMAFVRATVTGWGLADARNFPPPLPMRCAKCRFRWSTLQRAGPPSRIRLRTT